MPRALVLKNAVTAAWFAKRYQVDMSQALVEDLTAYEHFNAFFTRALKDGAPSTGRNTGRDPQPGRRRRSASSARSSTAVYSRPRATASACWNCLGGDAANAAPFMGGDFATIYLSPKDYHRAHAAGRHPARDGLHPMTPLVDRS